MLLALLFAGSTLGADGAAAQAMTTSPSRSTDEQSVLAAEDEYVAAEIARNEPVLRRLLDDRFAFNTSKGTVTAKEAFIRNILGLTMTDQKIRERTVLVEGDIAMVFGTAELRFANPGKDDAVETLRYTSTYVKREGGWRMLALQMQQRAPQ